jgi:hypothetical protein
MASAETVTSITELVLHPVRWRIVQRALHREVTTTQLREELPDIAQTTLYRHVSTLLQAGVLRVVREERIRGTVERTYAIAELDALRERSVAEGRELTVDQLRGGLTLMLAQIAADFERLAAHGDIAPSYDYLSFGQTAVHLRAEDVPKLSEELLRVLGPYTEPPAEENARRVLLSVIAVPDPPDRAATG